MPTNYLNYTQLALIFANGFIISRLFIKCGIAEKIIFFFIKKSKGSVVKIIYYIIFTSCFISMFIPNVITVLALLPLVNIMVKDLNGYQYNGKPVCNTSIALSNLYGSNIGGTGSINGSAANAILIGFFELKNIAQVNKIDFITWLVWGIPLVLILSLVGGFALTRFCLPKKIRKTKVDFTSIHEHRERYVHQKIAIVICIISFSFWMTISSINLINKNIIMPYTTILALIYMIAFIFIIFIIPIHDKNFNEKSRILIIKDFYTDLPIKGFAIAGITILLSVILLYLKVDQKIAPIINIILPEKGSMFLVIFIFSLFSIYLSEFISNTSAAISLFIIALPISAVMNLNPFYILFAISLVSTLTFMSPVANAVNALAYGGVKNVSLNKMIRLGIFTDLIAVILITILATFILPLVYG